MAASEIRIERAWLDGRLGGWGSGSAFGVNAAGQIVSASDIDIHPLQLGSTPTFTLGSNENVLLTERPMWASVTPFDGGVYLDLEDGDHSGQEIMISKKWLASYRIGRPVAMHEDRTPIPTRQSHDYRSYVFGVPHFSRIVLGVGDIDVKERVAGVLAPHMGQKIWDSDNKTLEIEIGAKLADEDVLVEADWVDAHFDHLALLDHPWQSENISGDWYYVVSLEADQTPATLMYMEFSADNRTVFTLGSPYSVLAFDNARFLRVDTATNGSVVVEATAGNGTSMLAINYTFLANFSITNPEATNPSGGRPSAVYLPGELEFPLEVMPGETTALMSIRNSERLAALSGSCQNAWNGQGAPVKNWIGDEGESQGHATAYVWAKQFCWDWSVTGDPTCDPTDCTNVDDPDFFLIGGAVYDMDDPSVGCAISAVTNTQIKGGQGRIECAWPGDSLATHTGLIFNATAISHPENDADWQRWGNDFAYDVAECAINYSTAIKGAGKIFQMAGELKWAKRAKFLARIVGVVENSLCFMSIAGDGLSAKLEHDKLERFQDAIISQSANGATDVTSWTDLDLKDENPNRRDTWDRLETNGVHTTYANGSQGVRWAVHNLRHGAMEYQADRSRIFAVSAATSSADEFTVDMRDSWMNATQEVGYDTFDRWLEIQDPDTSAWGGVDWEAPEFPCQSFADLTSDDGGTNSILFADPLASGCGLFFNQNAAPCDPWLSFTVHNSTLGASSLNMTGNVSLNDVMASNGSVILALARAATTDDSLVAGDLEIQDGGGFPLEYTYFSLMAANSRGYSPADASDVESPTVSMSVPIVFSTIPT